MHRVGTFIISEATGTEKNKTKPKTTTHTQNKTPKNKTNNNNKTHKKTPKNNQDPKPKHPKTQEQQYLAIIPELPGLDIHTVKVQANPFHEIKVTCELK